MTFQHVSTWGRLRVITLPRQDRQVTPLWVISLKDERKLRTCSVLKFTWLFAGNHGNHQTPLQSAGGHMEGGRGPPNAVNQSEAFTTVNSEA